ncbi:unnamed protein product [Coregonus sp. 'balchen']|nr:unnamed protein product [Coregonus sp. 'balchen']
MEIDTLLEAFTDFEKKGKKDACPALDQLLSHVAKTGETMISWSQFKSYFLFKLEKVMDDFRTSTPDQRGPANPNVEYIPFEEMKERILKIVDGYNGIPFTIQRLCELLTEPKRNYTGTDKFLRGNVMVVSCVYPTSEKNGATSVNRMNGVMFPGNTSIYSRRNINGPGTPRPLNRPKLLLSTSLATNGLPDSTDDKEPLTEQEEEHVVSDSSVSESDATKTSLMKTKHPEEDATEAEIHSVKRLKFEKDMDEDEMSEPSSTQTEEPFDEEETAETSEREAESGPTNSLKSDSTMDQSEEQLDQSGKDLSLEEQGEGDCSDPVSSSSSNGEGAPSEEPVPSASPSSKAESLAEGAAAENSSESPETADEPMEQD